MDETLAGSLRRIASPLLFLAVFATAAAVLGYIFVISPFEIDRCLDAGGRWNADRESCEVQRGT